MDFIQHVQDASSLVKTMFIVNITLKTISCDKVYLWNDVMMK